VQQQLVGFLPEVASPEEHERVVEALLGWVHPLIYWLGQVAAARPHCRALMCSWMLHVAFDAAILLARACFPTDDTRLLEQDTGFVACVLDAVGDMQLEPGLQVGDKTV
jgi:hypothetical protein